MCAYTSNDPETAAGLRRIIAGSEKLKPPEPPEPEEKEPMTRVAGVITKDTRKDISDLINRAAEQHGFDPIGFLAGLIGESNLSEQATRENAWPDCSWGLSQPVAAYLYKDSGLDLERAANGVVLDTPENRRKVREWAFDAANLIPYTARRYAELRERFKTDDPLELWSRWNAPGLSLEENERQQPYVIRNYRRGLAEAEKYRVEEKGPRDMIAPIDLRGELPILGRGQSYGRRSLGQITGITYHYTASRPDTSIRAIAEYQISEAATPQTGAGQPFPGIAYHIVVKGGQQAGLPHLCWDLDVVTWHAGPANASQIALCYIGNGPPTEKQLLAMAKAHVWAEQKLGRRLAVQGHKDVVQTTCPGGWPAWRDRLIGAIYRERERPPERPIPAAAKERILTYLDAIWGHAREIEAAGRRDVAEGVRKDVVSIKRRLGEA